MPGWDTGGAEREGTQELCSSSVPCAGLSGHYGPRVPVKAGFLGSYSCYLVLVLSQQASRAALPSLGTSAEVVLCLRSQSIPDSGTGKIKENWEQK